MCGGGVEKDGLDFVFGTLLAMTEPLVKAVADAQRIAEGIDFS